MQYPEEQPRRRYFIRPPGVPSIRAHAAVHDLSQAVLSQTHNTGIVYARSLLTIVVAGQIYSTSGKPCQFRCTAYSGLLSLKTYGPPYLSITTFPEPEPAGDIPRTALRPQYHTSVRTELDSLDTINSLLPLARQARIRRLPTQECTWHVPAGKPPPVRHQVH